MSTEITSEFVWHNIPPRPRDSHKGSFGTVLAVAGSAYYRGAALLAAEGALRTGAGIVTLASVEPVLAAAVARLPECCLCPCVAGAEGGISPESIPQLQRQKATVLLLGPGLGGTAQSAARAAETRTLVQKLLPGFAGSAVLDADGLNAAAQLLAALEMHKLVDRWGLNGGTAPAPSENAAPLETVEPSPLPLLLEGRFYAARNADGDWYLVQGQDVYLPDTDRLAGFVGRLNHQKNPLFLMEVFAAMAAHDPHWKLLLVGTGEMEPEMRAAAARRLPPQLADAPKRGFPVPLADWLRQEKYYALVKAKLTGPAAERFFDTGALCALLDAHRAGKTNAMTKLWAFYCFIEWYEVYFTGKIPPDL